MIRIDAGGLAESFRRLETELQRTARQALLDAAAHAHAHAKTTTSFKDRTGHLRQSITRGERGPFATFVQAGASYAAYVEYGTRPRAGHPGTRPRRFMHAARESASRFVEAGGAGVFR
jgi:HK97 gp10 family phage protein